MKNTLKISITSLVSLILFTFVSQAFAMQPVTNNKITLLSPEQAQKYIKETKDFFLLDVRTPSEYAEKNLAGSTLIPLKELATRLDELPTDKDILIRCKSGKRATKAANIIAPALPDTAKIYVINGFVIYP